MKGLPGDWQHPCNLVYVLGEIPFGPETARTKRKLGCDHSFFSASTGLMAATREAGRRLANTDAAARMNGTVAKLKGSRGLTPNNSVLSIRATAAAVPRPMM